MVAAPPAALFLLPFLAAAPAAAAAAAAAAHDGSDVLVAAVVKEPGDYSESEEDELNPSSALSVGKNEKKRIVFKLVFD